MEIRTTSEQGVAVVTIEGRLDASGVPQAEAVFQKLVDTRAKRILLNMSGVEYMSSSGLRLIIMLSKGTENHGGRLAFCQLSPFVLDVLEITHLASQLEIFPSREEALAALGG